jgi:Bacterial regulatory proteins, luxR family
MNPMNNSSDALSTSYFEGKLTNSITKNAQIEVALLPDVMADIVDGILILTEQQQVIYINDCAVRILRLLSQYETFPNAIPREIWHLCQVLIESRNLFPDQYWLWESKILISTTIFLHMRVRWLKIATIANHCLLIVLEDEQQSLKNIVNIEAQKYGLTAREQEIWRLHRSHYTYKQIAVELNITPNTVKKHMKSILAKQKEIAESG